MPQIYLIGIGMGNPDTLTVRAQRIIGQSDCLIGAKRMLESVENDKAVRISSIKNEEIVSAILQQPQDSIISVLLSGDVGFYSAAKKLCGCIRQSVADTQLELICGISSLQYFCAKIETSWDDLKVISVHGRENNVPAAVQKFGKVFVLTGSNQTAGDVCKALCHYGLSDALVWVGEELSYPQEKISHGTAEELSGQIFSSLAVMVIEGKKVPQTDYPAIGLADEMFLRNTEGKTVPMTKQEIRAVALSRLQITEDACVYDVGAGTGSVSIEAALTARGGRVYAIEKNPQAVEQLYKNRELFGAQNMQIVSGSAPQALLPLPAPDFVFVGGSSGNLSEILQLCFSKNPKVRVVVTAVTLETVGEMLCCAKELGNTFSELCFEVTQVSCTRSRQAGSYHLMNGMNPVWIGCLFQKED